MPAVTKGMTLLVGAVNDSGYWSAQFLIITDFGAAGSSESCRCEPVRATQLLLDKGTYYVLLRDAGTKESETLHL